MADPKKRRSTKTSLETGETHQSFASTSVSDPAKVRAFAIDAARLLADNKCEDVVLLDVTGLSQLSDYIVLASGTSDRQMRSSGDDLGEVGAKHGWSAFRSHADDRSTWIIVDFVDVVAHIFEPNTRAHYDLEMLWADAPRVEWEREVKGGTGGGSKGRNRAGLE